jgi:hypothetical protein
MLMGQINYNLLFRWFVGLPMDAEVWHPTVFTHNRDGSWKRMWRTSSWRRVGLTAGQEASVERTLLGRWHADRRLGLDEDLPAEGRLGGEPPSPGRNGEHNFRKEKRSNETHASTTDPDARLYRKAEGRGHATRATGTAEREATLAILDRRKLRRRITLGADKAYYVTAFVEDLRSRAVTPHIAIDGWVSKHGVARKTAVDGRTTRHPAYQMSQICRKRIEGCSAGSKRKPGSQRPCYNISG